MKTISQRGVSSLEYAALLTLILTVGLIGTQKIGTNTRLNFCKGAATSMNYVSMTDRVSWKTDPSLPGGGCCATFNVFSSGALGSDFGSSTCIAAGS